MAEYSKWSASGSIPIDLEDFRNVSPTGSPFDLYYNVERIADVRLYGPVREFDPALEDAARESREPLLAELREWSIDFPSDRY